MKEYRYFTKTFTRPAGTATGTYTERIDFPTGYQIVEGCNLYEITTGSSSYYRVGLKTEGGVYIQELTHKNDWICSTAVNPSERYKPLNINSTSVYTLEVFFPENLSGTPLTFDLTFIISKEL
jgi:hypothetical protein